LAGKAEFVSFGITGTSVVEVAAGTPPALTTGARHSAHLDSQGIVSLDYNNFLLLPD
jgi:hypothetical protein